MTIEKEVLARLTNEIAVALYREGDVPCSAWIVIEDLVEESFGDWETERLTSVTDELAVRRDMLFEDDETDEDDAEEDDGDDDGIGENGEPLEADWNVLAAVVDECCTALDIYRTDEDDDIHVPMLEVPSHAR